MGRGAMKLGVLLAACLAVALAAPRADMFMRDLNELENAIQLAENDLKELRNLRELENADGTTVLPGDDKDGPTTPGDSEESQESSEELGDSEESKESSEELGDSEESKESSEEV